MVGGDVGCPSGDGGADVGERTVDILSRQRIHEVEVEVLEMCMRDLHGAMSFPIVVHAPNGLQPLRIETLDAHRQPIDAQRPEGRELRGLEGPRVRFQRNLGIGLDGQHRPRRRKEAVERLGGK
jgi:hypothetical protein